MEIVENIFRIVAENGSAMYGGESVTQLQHALQCAALAEEAGESEELIAAALLHDYGHLVVMDEGAAAAGRDMRHEEIAADALRAWFGPNVTEPIRLHVAAKRYLCAVDADYFSTLSPASVTSLNVQGGPFTAAEAETFITSEHGAAAVKLRVWDDLAKDTEKQTPPLDHYRGAVERVCATQ